MSSNASNIADELGSAVRTHLSSHGGKLIEAHEGAAGLLVSWLRYLRASERTGSADELLDGLQASMIEVAGCLALGLVRPAIFALRAQVDILFSWLFFKDHAVEWSYFDDTGEKYRLVSMNYKYLKGYNPPFERRLKALREKSSRGPRGEDPYALLSAHVHSQSTATMAPLGRVPALVQVVAKCEECVGIQEEVAEYLSDVLLALYADEWVDLPHEVRQSVETRLSPPELKKLCES